jgi:hypothetical protein
MKNILVNVAWQTMHDLPLPYSMAKQNFVSSTCFAVGRLRLGSFKIIYLTALSAKHFYCWISDNCTQLFDTGSSYISTPM